MDEFVYIPEFLSVDEDQYGVAPAATGDFCGEANCCETYCSQYCQNGQSCNQGCNQGCSQSCGQGCSQTCGETCYGQYCGEGGCCETYCSQYCQSDQTCGESCGETCGESCGEDCGESGGEPTASITVTDIGSNYVQLYITVDPAYKYYRIFCRQFDNEDDVTTDVYGLYRTSNFYYTISRLTPDTRYILNLGVNNTGASHGTWVYSGGDNPTFRTDTDGEFEWTYAGLDANGNPVLGGSKEQGYGVYITAAEWNEFIAFVNDKFGSNLGTVTRGTTISAAIVNAAARVVGTATVATGTIISAAFFNNLKNAANA